MSMSRLLKHLTATQWRTRLRFPKATLDAIEQAVGLAERTHAGEIRFAIETSLAPMHVLRGISAHQRAKEVFAALRVWDTAGNNGVLIYVQLADRHVEIIADRGFDGLVSLAEWEAVCRLMEGHFRSGRFQDGAIAGVQAIGNLLARHFPSGGPHHKGPLNELPDRPTLL